MLSIRHIMDKEDPIMAITTIVVVFCCCCGCVGYSLYRTFRPPVREDVLLEDIV